MIMLPFKKANSVEDNVTAFDSPKTSFDQIYAPLLTDNCRCFVSFAGNSKDYSDFFQMDITREKKMIPFVDERGAYRYGASEYTFSSHMLKEAFYFKQNADGASNLYLKSEDAEQGMMIFETKKSTVSPIDPAIAFFYRSSFYIVFNKPTSDTLAKSGKKRYPSELNGIVGVSGSLIIWKIDIEEKTHKTIFYSKCPLSHYFVALISSPKTGQPGLLTFHNVRDKKKDIQQNGPATFSDLVDAMYSDDIDGAAPSNIDIPLGISVYNFKSRSFDMIALEGNETWGIDGIIIEENKESNRIVFSIVELVRRPHMSENIMQQIGEQPALDSATEKESPDSAAKTSMGSEYDIGNGVADDAGIAEGNGAV